MTRVPAILITQFPDVDEVARNAVHRWSRDDVLIERVAVGASFTFRFVVAGEHRYLRLTPPGWRSRTDVAGEVAFIQHLDAKGIPLARPVASANGGMVEAMDSSLGECLAVVFEDVRGDALDDADGPPERAREAGRLMAHMHLAAYDFALPPGATRLSWRDELLGLEGEWMPSETELRDMVDMTALIFRRLPTTPDCYGVVHFDLSGNNIVWRSQSPAAIDFDDCMLHWYVADIARTIGRFRETAGGRIGPHELAFLDGYREIRQIDPEWMRLLPAFLRLALISELAWMTYASRSDPHRLQFTSQAEANLRRLIAAFGGI